MEGGPQPDPEGTYGRKLTMVNNHLLNGMILQVGGGFKHIFVYPNFLFLVGGAPSWFPNDFLSIFYRKFLEMIQLDRHIYC